MTLPQRSTTQPANLEPETDPRKPDDFARPALVFGLRRSAVIEVLLAVSALLALDHFLGSGLRFRGIEPHPFWIVVLIVAVYYGALEGMFAAAICSTALLVGNLPPQHYSDDIYAWLFDVTRLPVLWGVSALILGELNGLQRRERNRLRRDLAAMARRQEELTGAYGRLEDLNEQLEARIAGQLRTVFAVHNAAKAIEKLDTSEVLIGVVELVRGIMGPQKFSLFLLNNNFLEAAISEGWSPADHFAREFTDTAPLFQSVVAERRFLSVTHENDEHLLAGEGVLAGPLASVDTGEVIGMLKVEQIGFLDLSLTGIENFRLLCNWIGTSFANARRFELLAAGGQGNQASFRAFAGRLAGGNRPVAALITLPTGADAAVAADWLKRQIPDLSPALLLDRQALGLLLIGKAGQMIDADAVETVLQQFLARTAPGAKYKFERLEATARV